jgi:hypothetical protein
MTEVVVQPTLVTITPPSGPQVVVGPQPVVTVSPSGVIGVVGTQPTPVIGPGASVSVTLGQVMVVGVAQGPPGPPGPPGASGSNYVHDQAVASTTWTIVHPLSKHPAVHIEDSSHRVVIGELEYPDDSTVIARFTAPFGGKAYLN